MGGGGLGIHADTVTAEVTCSSRWNSIGLGMLPGGMPLMIDAVMQWIVLRYLAQIGQRGLIAAVGATFFSLFSRWTIRYRRRTD
jgi:hypothetical protein